MRTSTRPSLAVSMCLFAAGCASLPPPPAAMPEDPKALGVRDSGQPPLQLRPGDRLQVAVETEPAPDSWDITVDAQGRVHLAGIGEVRVGGLSVAEAERRVEAAVRRRDRLASVSLQVTGFDGQRATVLGAVAHQGSVRVSPGMRVSELIAQSGGILTMPDPVTASPVPAADLDSAVLTRSGRVLPIDLARATGGDPRHDVYVHAGDHLFVPSRRDGAVVVFGQVGSPGVFTHSSDLRLTQALALAGGITVGGDKSDVRLLRGAVDTLDVYSADFAAIVDGGAPDVALQPGDVLFVTDDPIEDLGEVFNLVLPFATLSTALVLSSLLVATQ